MQEIEEIINEIRARLAILKKEQSLGDKELGKHAGGVSHTTIGNILNGKVKDPGVSIFINIARNLSLDIAWLLEGRPDKARKNKIINLQDRTKEEIIREYNKLQSEYIRKSKLLDDWVSRYYELEDRNKKKA